MTAVENIIAASRLAEDPEAWYPQQPARVYVNPDDPGGSGAFAIPPEPDGDHPLSFQCLAVVMRLAQIGQHVVYPSGLVLPQNRVNCFWEFPDEVRQGTADQALRYCIRRNIDPEDVFPVARDRIHGTHVRYEGEREDGRDYRLVHARAFPAWTGV